MSFRDKWLEAVDTKNSVLVAGIDPAEYEMGRFDNGLPVGENKLEWSMRYIDAVAPYVAGIKPNLGYWLSNAEIEDLEALAAYAGGQGLVTMLDAKISDIGSTNDAWFYAAKTRNFDAVTLALYAGNLQQASRQLEDRQLGGIHMVLMSNPEYEHEKNKLVLADPDDYQPVDVIDTPLGPHVRQYVHLARESYFSGMDGIVLGAPSPTNHIHSEEIQAAAFYANDMLVLAPGVGAQGGKAEVFWKFFRSSHVMVPISRALMLPEGSTSEPKDQAAAARHYKGVLNEMRGA